MKNVLLFGNIINASAHALPQVINVEANKQGVPVENTAHLDILTILEPFCYQTPALIFVKATLLQELLQECIDSEQSAPVYLRPLRALSG